MTEPVIHVQKIRDPQARGIRVEVDEARPSLYCVSASRKLEWLTALEAVTSFIETQQHKGRDD